jgi:hypothetical protein
MKSVNRLPQRMPLYVIPETETETETKTENIKQ